ncbi:acyltransferase family protein [Kosakonia oryzae]|nr:acyltransferase [Kosakonia oryzae]
MFSVFFKYNVDVESRNIQLDSIRFFLASSVMFSHSIYMYHHIRGPKWMTTTPILSFYAMIGVAMFFSITGFLFWGKVSKDDNPNWISLFINRFFRIVPLIIINVICIVIVYSFYAWLSERNTHISYDLIYWFDFLNNTKKQFNGISSAWVATAGVYWTLVYEWGFYFSLPILWMLGRKNRSTAFTIGLIFLIIYLLPGLVQQISFYVRPFAFLHFVIGMLVWEVKNKIIISKKVADVLLLFSVGYILFFGYKTGEAVYDTSSYINFFIFLILLLLSKGADLWGVLKFRIFVLLGEASYSIYIMHGVVIFTLLRIAQYLNVSDRYIPFLFLVSYVTTYLVSIMTYFYIEKPFIFHGKKIVKLYVKNERD